MEVHLDIEEFFNFVSDRFTNKSAKAIASFYKKVIKDIHYDLK